jgi:hypothetical protein
MLLLAKYHQRGRLQIHVLYAPATLSVRQIFQEGIPRNGPYLLSGTHQIQQCLATINVRSERQRIGRMEVVDWAMSVA